MELLLIGPTVIVIGLYIWLGKKSASVGKALVLGGLIASLIPAALVAILLIAFMTVHQAFFVSVMLIVCLLLIVTVAIALFGKIRKKRVWIPLVCAWVILFFVLGGGIAYQKYEDELPTVGESDDLLYQYRPSREHTKAVSPDAPVMLTFTEEVPRMDGATALYPIYASFARSVYAVGEKEMESAVVCTTTAGAYESIVTGAADIIFVAGPSPAQEQFAKDNGVELVYTPIGREAFVFFVNSQNPIENITLEQIRAVYSGEITEWEALGVSGFGGIRAFQRDAGSGSQTTLEKLMAGKSLMEAPKKDVIDGMGGIIDMTADYKNYKNAIGYSFRFYSTEMVKNDQIKLLSLNGVAPTLENIENGTYPVASYFYAVTRADASENTKLLLDWILGEQGQEIIEKVGYTPLH